MMSGIYDPARDEGEFCITCDMGQFDLVVLQSDNKPLLEYCMTQSQPYFEKGLKILPYKQVRHFDWSISEVFSPKVY